MMQRRTFLTALLGLGAAAATVAASGEALAAMPVAAPPAPTPVATTAEVQPGRDTVPTVENARFHFRRRRRRVFFRRRRRAFFRRRRRF